MASSKDMFATSYKLGDFIQAQKVSYPDQQEASSQNSKHSSTSSQADIHIHKLLCWAY